jgi:hypothetical protein
MSRPETISIISEILSTPIAYLQKKNYYLNNPICVETIETTSEGFNILTISQKGQRIYHGECLNGRPNGSNCQVYYPNGAFQYQGELA